MGKCHILPLHPIRLYRHRASELPRQRLLHLKGFGAKALSGASVSDPAVHAACCGPGERLANWVIAGRPVRAAHPKAGAEASAVISGWRMDQG